MTPTPTPTHPHPDPLTALQRSTRAWTVAASVAVVAVGVWAWWPVSNAAFAIEVENAEPVSSPAAPKLAFNTEAFSAPVWVPTPPPPAAPVVAQKPPPPPLKLQLIGITRDTPVGGGDGAVLRAALYDPDSDKLLIVAAGEKITVKGTPGYTVARLTADAIDLSDGETTRTLSLRDERRAGS